MLDRGSKKSKWADFFGGIWEGAKEGAVDGAMNTDQGQEIQRNALKKFFQDNWAKMVAGLLAVVLVVVLLTNRKKGPKRR